MVELERDLQAHRRCDVAVLGAGSWGTALAILLARNGHETLLWGRDEATLAGIARSGSNEKIPARAASPRPVGGRAESLAGRRSGERFARGRPQPCLQGAGGRNCVHAGMPDRPVVGNEGARSGERSPPPRGSGGAAASRRTLGCACPDPHLPVRWRDVSPTAVTLAASDAGFAREWAGVFRIPGSVSTRATISPGVQIAGGVKNVLATAAGIADGLGFGGEYPSRAHRAGPERNGSARRGGRRARRDLHGARGTGRSGAYLHRRPVTQQEVRARSRAGGAAGASRGCRRPGGREHRDQRPGAGSLAAVRDRDADLRAGSRSRHRRIERGPTRCRRCSRARPPARNADRQSGSDIGDAAALGPATLQVSRRVREPGPRPLGARACLRAAGLPWFACPREWFACLREVGLPSIACLREVASRSCAFPREAGFPSCACRRGTT